MRTLPQKLSFLFLTLALPASAFASASAAADALGVAGDRPVTRAEFLKAGVIVLGLSVDVKAPPRKYRVYPEALRAYVRAADEAGAFDAFGSAPDLTQPITRGEALRFIGELKTWNGTGAVMSFSDVPAKGDLEHAVRLAVQNGWMRALRQHTFGVNALLHAGEARSLLTRVTGEQPVKVKVKVLPKKNDPVDFTSKKFRDQVQSLLQNEYLYDNKVQTGTGMTAEQFVKSLNDPYTTLFDPKEAQAFRDQLGGTLTGIGTHIDLVDGALQVVAVVKGSPAERAGILAGDQIVSVNRKKLTGMEFTAALNLIRGPEGTPVRIGILRDDDALSFDMIRAVIEVPDTELEFRSNVAIVSISQFGDHLLHDADQLFHDVLASNPTGIIIDLRNNPGGYLEAAPAVVGKFLPKGSIYVRTRGSSLNEMYVTAQDPVIPEDVPLIVLVNNNSASAAEIVTGALQDSGRATILGTTTFGKGTVQTVYNFQNKASLKFTIAEWLTPDGNPINKVGITPDVVVEQSDAGDAQLEKAMELILNSR